MKVSWSATLHTNKKYIKAVAAAAIAKKVIEEIVVNRNYYTDFMKFNFMNGIKSDKAYRKIYYYDLPPKERNRITRLYRNFSHLSVEEIYDRLNTPMKVTNRTMPLETRWVYAYRKKYGTSDYYENNQISDHEILKCLTASEAEEYSRMF